MATAEAKGRWMSSLKDKTPQNRIRNWCRKAGYRLFKVPSKDEWYIIDPDNKRLVSAGRMAELAGKFLRKPID